MNYIVITVSSNKKNQYWNLQVKKMKIQLQQISPIADSPSDQLPLYFFLFFLFILFFMKKQQRKEKKRSPGFFKIVSIFEHVIRMRIN